MDSADHSRLEDDPMSEAANGDLTEEQNLDETFEIVEKGPKREKRETVTEDVVTKTTTLVEYLVDGKVAFSLFPCVKEVKTSCVENVDVSECSEEEFLAAEKKHGRVKREEVPVKKQRAVVKNDVVKTEPKEQPKSRETSIRSAISQDAEAEAAGFAEGDLVLALLTSTHFYPGKVVSMKDDELDIKFSNGDEKTVISRDVILAKDYLKSGNPVQVQLTGTQSFGKAIVKEVTGSDDDTEVMLEFDDKNQETRNIADLCAITRDIRKVMSASPAKAAPVSARKDATTSEARTRPKVVRLIDSPVVEKKSTPMVKKEPAKPKSSKKKSPKVVVPAGRESSESVNEDVKQEDEEDKEAAESGRKIRIGTLVLSNGDQVFGKWTDDGRWYSAVVLNARQNKFKVKWLENEQVSFLSPEDLILAVDILQPGVRVNVMMPGKNYYDEVTFEQYMDDGEHIVRRNKGQQITKKFEEMMINPKEVARWNAKREQKAKEKSGTVEKRASGAAEVTPLSLKKRARSVSPEPDSTSQAPSKSASAKSTKKQSTEGKSGSPEMEFSSGPPFAGCSFIVTSGAERDTTFDRDFVVGKIAELGGAVLNTFDDLMSSSGQRFLIAPTACRTAKYFQCLAANFPCVSHKWILESAAFGKSVSYRPFRLPAGKSSANNKTVAWEQRPTLLDNMRVGLFGGETFRTTWMTALKAGKAEPVVIKDDETRSNMTRFDCVMSEKSPPSGLMESCNEDGIPVVTVEWIIQTLVLGKKQPFTTWAWDQEEEGASVTENNR